MKCRFLMLPALTLTFFQTQAQTQPPPTLQTVTDNGRESKRDNEHMRFKNVSSKAANYLRWYNEEGTPQPYIGK
ncbi:hypothetical protein [Chitinophaga qingshengii]|uniref:GLPGLI family protein n=1 Tax=Chitinophaga qingshengii TaxID=1569794 RepID=A0ABR7TH31_9BACT|nr:hypothetical protein [Chitinophaga qingshengii]MBC9928930.1 hypothetical protein [Chitinophaga qingshengii]